MNLKIPELCLVALVGASGSGKSTFARQHFQPTEVISLEMCRLLLADDTNDPDSMEPAWDLLRSIVLKRLALGRLTVIDAANVLPENRKPLAALAKTQHVSAAALVFDLPEETCQAHNRQTGGRGLPASAIHRQAEHLHRTLGGLAKEGFGSVYMLNSAQAAAQAVVERQPMPSNRKSESGPFDLIGDLHGCCDELEELLGKLGYQAHQAPGWVGPTPVYTHPAGRRVIFLGDLGDRGPRILDTIQLVFRMVQAGSALCTPGNHDDKLLRWLEGRTVNISPDMLLTLDAFQNLPDPIRDQTKGELAAFLGSLFNHYVLDEGRLVAAHAGMRADLIGRDSSRVRSFALYGETTGETDENGLPVRLNWTADYHGRARVVYGHTPVTAPEWQNKTLNIDTGCVFGGSLTALRYPELELVSVPARRVYDDRRLNLFKG